MAQDLSYSPVQLVITSNVNNSEYVKKFNVFTTVHEFKAKLELITGCMMGSMKLEFSDKDRNKIDPFTESTLRLVDLNLQDGYHVHVTDPTGGINVFGDDEDVSFKLTDEDYSQKTDTALNFKMRHNLGRFKPTDSAAEKLKSEQLAAKRQEEKDMIDSFQLEQRCEIRIPSNPDRRGTIKYIGELEGKNGHFVGVCYDEPVGKNDGSLDGKQYFTCASKYGGFVKPTFVNAGDFPELGVEELDEI